ncbi:MAG: 16S rRNA (cytidine(1402)-2'-O)-methyltransferase [Clostridia bacterium]|nr:16S rRNA (cytidine(1402)-2'-O)-methyltransferase [Clostridia bacterium]
MSGKLILVGTPIGNLGDFSPRAVSALQECDFIAAEDTRVTLKLLNHFEINKPLISYYEHNKREREKNICDRILAGETCVLVSDAGMPAISDPGEELVVACARLGIEVGVVPGPTAAITALTLSGLPTGRFTFEGFLSVSKKSRKAHLEEIARETRTMIFYEAPHKLRYTLEDLYNTLGDRKIAIVRELTKIHEEVFRTTLSEAIKYYEEQNPRGEYVLIIEGAQPAETESSYTLEQAAQIAEDLIKDGMSASDAAKAAAVRSGLKKRDIYSFITKK